MRSASWPPRDQERGNQTLHGRERLMSRVEQKEKSALSCPWRRDRLEAQSVRRGLTSF
jgi:hypothetical protein